MARCFLPCESEAWPEDRRFFTLLSQLNSLEEFQRLIDSHSKEISEEISMASRFLCLRGLVVFLTKDCSEEEREVFFRRTLPFIARSASFLDMVVPEGGIPFVQQQEAATVSLSRKLVRSLLANAFLCTFPQEHPLGSAYQQRFGFNHFFDVFLSDTDASLHSSQAAKLKCVLNYFDRSLEQEDDSGVSAVICLTRQVLCHQQLPSIATLLASQYPLCPVTLEEEKAIEDAGSRTLPTVFSSSCIGGDVLGGGMDQEESRFSSCPEMLVAMLIMDELTDNESIIITGVERFSTCLWQKDKLEFGGNYQEHFETDVYGNLNTATVAMAYKRPPADLLYKQETVLRDLYQALSGYLCHDDQGDLNSHLISLSEWTNDDPNIEADLSALESSSQVTMDDLDDEEEEASSTIEDFAEGLCSATMKAVMSEMEEKESEGVKTVEDLAAMLSTNAIKEAVRKSEKPDRVTAAELVASTLTDSILSSAIKCENPPTLSISLPDGTTNSFANNLAQEILHDVKQDLLSSPMTGPAVPTIAPVLTSGSTSGSQVEEAGSGSRRGSRSSDYTGQPLLPDEYTDSLVEEAIRSGLNAAVHEEQTREPIVTLEVPQVVQPPDDNTVALATSLVATAFEKAKETIATSPKKTVLSMSSAGKKRLSPTKQRKTPKKTSSKKAKHLGVSLTDGGGYLAPPISRMSISWSVASTRDDESVPTSPTELDQIALGMVSSIDEYSSLLADLIIKEVLTMNSTPQQLQLAEYGEGGLSFRVQTYLHSLGEVSSYSLDPETAGVPPFSPHCYNLRKALLRAVATGHNKESGDPQLQAIIQWIAVSMCGRPEMIYSTFKKESLQQFPEIVSHWISSGKTTGDLSQALVDYCTKGDTTTPLFDVLLKL